jgi:hypothetical protein
MFLVLLLTGAVTVQASSFGMWAADPTGAPAFLWHGGCPPASNRTVCPTSRSLIHAAGNDRVAAVLYNDGTVALRQDEGGPKVLNGYSPPAGQFGGALGFLADATSVLASTATDGPLTPGGPLQATLGVGFAAKTAATARVRVEHAVTALFGDDSAVLITVDVEAAAGGDLDGWRWTEAWGGLRVEHGGAPSPAAFAHAYTLLAGPSGAPLGLLDTVALVGRGPAPTPRGGTGGLPTPSDHDEDPRPSWLVCLSCAAGAPPPAPGAAVAVVASYTTAAGELFGTPNSSAPVLGAVTRGLSNTTTTGGDAGSTILQVRLAGRGAQRASFAFLFGYALPGEAAAAGVAARVARYAPVWPALRNASACAWAAAAPVFEPATAALSPEGAWAFAAAAATTGLDACLAAPPAARAPRATWGARATR